MSNPRFITQSPAAQDVVFPSEGLHHRIEIGRNREAKMYKIVSDIDRDKKVLRRQQRCIAGGHPCTADAPAQEQHTRSASG